MHAETTWTLDITKDDEAELLSNMRKNTRYYVRRGEKEGVTVEIRKDLAAVEEFYNIHKETVGRHHFTPFSLDYLKKQFEAFSADDQIAVFHAKFDGKILSSAIIPLYGDSAFYHHGASADMYSKVPSSYLLQWEIIREAKRRGLKHYNFWGIAPTDDKKHPWYGLSLFKKGFGGYSTELIPAQDL
jgi:lipid II:glycine glycyltransferase (peptidoglycan interpeptide bridge formation enzyme)